MQSMGKSAEVQNMQQKREDVTVQQGQTKTEIQWLQRFRVYRQTRY